MSYVVFARKYRPQTFDEVVGQDHVCHTLRNAIRENRVAHAYIFIGPKGTGKTSVARILAKALNCEKGPTPDPCGVCTACREITAGTDMDVIEIDGASNRGIDDIKALRESVQFSAGRDRFKIYIIDEVHMLSPDANNALLKTLEEPPSHIKFIFATTEPNKVIPTVFSRCQRFDFKLIPVDAIVGRLELIMKEEGLSAPREVLVEIARAAEGCMRDAQSILDQVVAYGIEGISPADVRRIVGSFDPGVVSDLLRAVFSRDTRKALAVLNEVLDSGADIYGLAAEMITFIRNAVVLHECGEDADVLPAAAAPHVEAMRAVLERAAVEQLLLAAKMLEDFMVKSKYLSCRRVLMEITLVNIMKMDAFVSVDELLRRVERAEAPGPGGDGPALSRKNVSPSAPPETGREDGKLRAFFRAVNREDKILGAALEADRITGRMEEGRLVLFTAGGGELSDARREMFESHEEWQQVIERKARDVFGPDVQVVYRFLQPARREEPPAPPEHGGERREESPLEKCERIRRYEPMVDMLIRAFKGKVLNVQEK